MVVVELVAMYSPLNAGNPDSLLRPFFLMRNKMCM
jgi:hypothetical protein